MSGLAPRPTSPAEVRPLPDGPLHFVGIGGAGQSAIAYVLAQRGRTVRGSDSGISEPTKARLESVGCEIFTQHAAENLNLDTAALIATDAVSEQNPEVAEALKRGIPVLRRPEALASLVNSAKTAICVAGTHGKTTTTGMIASILIHAGLNPTVLIGGDLPLIGGNSQNGDPDLVIAEACEAYGGLDCLSPTIAVITNCEPDHLDFHGSEENFYKAFERFISHSEILLACGEDEGSRNLATKHQLAIGDRFDQRVRLCGAIRSTIKLQVPGHHNALNAALAYSVAELLSVSRQNITIGLATFSGTGRRFERLGTVRDIAVVDDYAHHPTEIRATLQAARQAFPGRRIVAIYQPHLPSRTRDFLDAFADALSAADALYLTDIYLAREPEQLGLIETLAEKISALSLRAISPSSHGSDTSLPLRVRSSPGREAFGCPSSREARATGEEGVARNEPGEMADRERTHLIKDRRDLPATLLRELKPGDVALFMGAGNIREQAEEFLKIL